MVTVIAQYTCTWQRPAHCADTYVTGQRGGRACRAGECIRAGLLRHVISELGNVSTCKSTAMAVQLAAMQLWNKFLGVQAPLGAADSHSFLASQVALQAVGTCSTLASLHGQQPLRIREDL